MSIELSAVGQNIRAIRRRSHMSQKELAHRLGMRQGPVTNIEKGHNLPSATVLAKLAEALNVPIDAFFQPAGTYDRLATTVADAMQSAAMQSDGARAGDSGRSYVSAGPPATLSGARAILAREPDESARIDWRVLNRLGQMVDAVLTLEDLCGAQKHADLPLYLPFGLSDEGLAELSARMRRFLGISDAIIFDYLELFENAGMRILFCRLPSTIESIGCYDAINRNVFIFIRRNLTGERQLFRLLYELGRIYLLNRETDLALALSANMLRAPTRQPDPIVAPPADYRGKPLSADRAARRLAGLFLLPEPAVQATVRQLGIRPAQWTFDLLLRLKHRFGVSAEAFLYRLHELSLITDESRDALRERILAHYAANEQSEPGASLRFLMRNARIGDLLLLAERNAADDPELPDVRRIFELAGMQW